MVNKGVLKIKRSWVIPLLVGLLVVGVTGYWGYNQYREKEQLEVYMGNKYQQAFYELVEHVEQLQVLLGKSLVSTSERQNIMLLTDVWSHANTAQAELNKLPLAAQTVYQTAKFLSQTGDYCHAAARQNAEGKALTDGNRKQLEQLRQQAIKVADNLHNVENQVFAGNVNWVELVKSAKNSLDNGDNKLPDNVNDSLDSITDEMDNMPVLIYDGPFSDHIVNRKPQDLKGEEISRDDARQRAAKVVNISDEESISQGTTINSKIPSYNFQIDAGDEGTYSIDISKKGGHLVTMLNNREVDKSSISQSEAVDKAGDFLAINNYPNMESTYSEIKDNIAYISFAYKEKGIIIYPDIINVQVALDNGQILAVEALSYLMSHHSRDLEEAEIGENDARERASKTLEQIENIRLALIPQASLKETLTYEVRGTIGGETYLIYVNAQTGEEEQILKVIMGEKGTFAL
ncbi:MAG: germination protein YpeB [Firmicutes bacterium]|nr:germination protein YpeB [Bacillota bacterium]